MTERTSKENETNPTARASPLLPFLDSSAASWGFTALGHFRKKHEWARGRGEKKDKHQTTEKRDGSPRGGLPSHRVGEATAGPPCDQVPGPLGAIPSPVRQGRFTELMLKAHHLPVSGYGVAPGREAIRDFTARPRPATPTFIRCATESGLRPGSRLKTCPDAF